VSRALVVLRDGSRGPRHAGAWCIIIYDNGRAYVKDGAELAELQERIGSGPDAPWCGRITGKECGCARIELPGYRVTSAWVNKLDYFTLFEHDYRLLRFPRLLILNPVHPAILKSCSDVYLHERDEGRGVFKTVYLLNLMIG
jgi:hypothetical protein